jgi:hypothetical protein
VGKRQERKKKMCFSNFFGFLCRVPTFVKMQGQNRVKPAGKKNKTSAAAAAPKEVVLRRCGRMAGREAW